MTNILTIITTVFAVIYILFLPGFCLSLVFFSVKTLNSIERIALSVSLSLVVVPLGAFYMSMFGIKITTISVLIEVLVIIAFVNVIYLFRKRK